MNFFIVIFLILFFNIMLILNWSLCFYHKIKIKKNIIEPIGIHNPGHKFDELTRVDQNQFNMSSSQYI
jgi:hypothetical protein